MLYRKMVYRTCYYQTRWCYRRRRSRPTRIFLDRTELGKYFPKEILEDTPKTSRKTKRKTHKHHHSSTCNMRVVRQCVTDTLNNFWLRHPSVEYVCVQNWYGVTENCTHVTDMAERECISDACVYRINPIY